MYKKLSKSEFAKAKQYAEANKTDVLIYFINNACKTDKKELIQIAQTELNKRHNPEYCKGMNF